MTNAIESKPKGNGQSAQSNQPIAGLSSETKQALIRLLSRAEVAAKLNVCPHTVQRLTRQGLLRAITFNRRLIRYDPEVVDAFIRSAKA